MLGKKENGHPTSQAQWLRKNCSHYQAFCQTYKSYTGANRRLFMHQQQGDKTKRKDTQLVFSKPPTLKFSDHQGLKGKIVRLIHHGILDKPLQFTLVLSEGRCGMQF